MVYLYTRLAEPHGWQFRTLYSLGLLNSIYCHIRSSNRENRLIIDDQHSIRQAAAELCRSLFDCEPRMTPPMGPSMPERRRPCNEWGREYTLAVRLHAKLPQKTLSIPASLTTTTTVLRPLFQDHTGEPVPEENFWTSWCKGRLTEADTPTIRLGATPSGLTSAHLHHPPIFFYRPDALPAAQPTVSKH